MVISTDDYQFGLHFCPDTPQVFFGIFSHLSLSLRNKGWDLKAVLSFFFQIFSGKNPHSFGATSVYRRGVASHEN